METEQHYTQYDEQEKIKEFFGSHIGQYLDVGAACGIVYSNVYDLLLSGWSGTSVEASAVEFRTLQQNYREFKDRTTLVNAVIAEKKGFTEFYTEGQLSTTSKDHMKLWNEEAIKHSWTWDPSLNYAITLNKLLKHLNTDFDFVSIDVEGTNSEIVKSIKWKLLPNCKLICIEHEGKEKEFARYLKKFGFTVYHHTPVNLLLRR